MNQSLYQFFRRPDACNLDTCAQEQIHLSGMIQNMAAMVIIEFDTHLIVGVSDNLDTVLGIAPAACIGMPLGDLHDGIAREIAPMTGARITRRFTDIPCSRGWSHPN
ncbi:hypothetical protein ABMC89_10770 [Sulfitobacter sp. HNIBRBA3233]|uniref:hypothetical protein n=1 Tax=Sulfitobacter marinivivus TaxID=3158558 RepID=UPI0032E02E26